MHGRDKAIEMVCKSCRVGRELNHPGAIFVARSYGLRNGVNTDQTGPDSGRFDTRDKFFEVALAGLYAAVQ